MKKLIIITACMLASVASMAQTRVKQDAKGNYVALKRFADTCNKTGSIFTDSKGKVYPVYTSRTGKLFYNRTSRNGNVYKVYLKVE